MQKQVELTSILAHEAVLGKCNPQEDKVLLDVYDNPHSSDRDIAERTKLEISSVTARRNSLEHNEFLLEDGTKTSSTGKRVKAYCCSQKGKDRMYYLLQTRRIKRDSA